MKLKNFTNPKLCLAGLLFLATFAAIQAQPVLKARPMNVFTLPDTPVIINVASKSDLGTCNENSVGVAVLTAAQAQGTLAHGTVMLVSNNIEYTPATGFVGQDSLRYELACGGETSQAIILINMGDKPGNIMGDACAVDPVFKGWDITPTRTAQVNLSTYQNAITGDIDNDGIVEILIAANTSETATTITRPTSDIAIYKGNDLTAVFSMIHTVSPFSWQGATKYGIVKTKIAGKDSILIVVAEGDLYVRAYNYNNDLIWTSSEIYHASAYSNATPQFADFDKNGIPEVVVDSKIFDSSTGNILCTATPTPTLLENHAAIADVFNTGTLNYIKGNQIYDVDISAGTCVLHTGHPAITPPVIKSMSDVAAGGIADPEYTAATRLTVPAGTNYGGLAIDIDHDGKLEIVSARTTTGNSCVIYVADPETGLIKAAKYIPLAGIHGPVFAGDIDGDGNVELVLIKNYASNVDADPSNPVPENGPLILAYKYDGSPVLQEFWRLRHQDHSGSTGITLFDFDQDGKAELVYRDEQQMRILDGTAEGATNYPARNKAAFENKSGTSLEYPVVADIDGDGQAEILIGGIHSGVTSDTANRQGALWVFKSNNPDAPWAPARPVWNQYAYNPVYVNDDLSIPANPLNPATFFVDRDGNYHQPYNNFLQQATNFNGEGKMLAYGPNLDVNRSSIVYGTPVGTTVDVTFDITNTGDADFIGPLIVSAYEFANGSFTKFSTVSIAGDIAKGITLTITCTITNLPVGIDIEHSLQLRFNEEDGAFISPECNYSGNFSQDLFGAPASLMCGGETRTLTFFPENSGYTYYWYDKDPIINPSTAINLGFGDTYSFTKNTTQALEILYVRIHAGSDWLDNNIYELKTYLTPDLLVWNGTDDDWNNLLNWTYPNDPDPLDTIPEYAKYKLPAACTDVKIPDGVALFPMLSDTVSCNKIFFEDGAEIGRQDYLKYSKAFVEYEFDDAKFISGSGGSRERWHMLSVPLKEVFAADFAFGGYPEVYVYNFSIEHQAASVARPIWTLAQGNKEIVTPGKSFAYWLEIDATGAAADLRGLNLSNGSLVLPYFSNDLPASTAPDVHYNQIYTAGIVADTIGKSLFSNYKPSSGGTAFELTAQKYTVARTNAAYRLEDAIVNVPLDFTSDGAGLLPKLTFVGNPFMSSISFAALYTDNGGDGGKIKNGFQVFDGGAYKGYSDLGSFGMTSGANGSTDNSLTAFIAPKQAVVVEAGAGYNPLGDNLVFRAEHLTGHGTVTPRLAPRQNQSESESESGNKLDIVASNAVSAIRTFIATREGGSWSYGNMDARKLTNDISKIPEIYTLKPLDNSMIAAGANIIRESEGTIPLGLATGYDGLITLTFTGMDSYDAEITFIDVLAKTEIELTGKSSETYKFSNVPVIQNNKVQAVDDRFFIRFAPKSDDDDDGKNSENNYGTKVYPVDKTLWAISSSLIRELTVFDMEGRSIYHQKPDNIRHITPPLNTGIYTVRIVTDNCSDTVKVIVK